MRSVKLYDYSNSALCIRCIHGEIHIQQGDDIYHSLDDYEAICFLDSDKNNGVTCVDFKLDKYKQEIYEHLDDFIGCFEVDEGNSEDKKDE